MFFFFAGSLGQQVRQVLKTEAGRCIVCGSSKAVDLVEYDQVLKVLFVPIWRWPGKQPLLYCNNCSLFFPPSPPPPLDSSFSPPPPPLDSSNQLLRCNSCAHPVDPHFNFCPFCGSSLSKF